MGSLAQKAPEKVPAKSAPPQRVHAEQTREMSPIQRLQRKIGNQALQRMLQTQASNAKENAAGSESARSSPDVSLIPMRSDASVRIQPKLTINAPGDVQEQEADRVADQVMRMPEPGRSSADESPKRTAGQSHAQVQRKSAQANDSAGAAAPPIVHDVLRSPGQPLDAATRAFMEPRFGQDFSGVRVHTDPRAAASASAVNALAYTMGQNIYFGSQQFEPGTGAGDWLIAHELAHTIQQRDGGEKGQAFRISSPGEAAEARADAAADAVVSGRPVPDVGAAGAVIQRAKPVQTKFGSFDTRSYYPKSAPNGEIGDELGAQIVLDFIANDRVESTKIGLIQSVKVMKSAQPGGPLKPRTSAESGDPDQDQHIMGLGQPDPGRSIDRLVHPPGRWLPNTSPIYGVENRSVDGVAKALNQGTPSEGREPWGPLNQWGAHTKDPATGEFKDAVPARLTDTPNNVVRFDGQTFEYSFEVAALAVEGPMPVNTYLGSVSWGFRSDEFGKVTLAPLALVQAGVPSEAFMGAAIRWNAAVFHWPGKTETYESVDIPVIIKNPKAWADRQAANAVVIADAAVAAARMSTAALLARIAVADAEIARLAGHEREKKEIEKGMLEFELAERKIKVSVRIIDTEGWWGPDNVFVTLIGSRGDIRKAPAHSLNDGESYDFFMPVTPLLPLAGPIRIKVYNHHYPEPDTLIVDMNFAAPWNAVRNARSMNDADYTVTAAFDR